MTVQEVVSQVGQKVVGQVDQDKDSSQLDNDEEGALMDSDEDGGSSRKRQKHT